MVFVIVAVAGEVYASALEVSWLVRHEVRRWVLLIYLILSCLGAAGWAIAIWWGSAAGAGVGFAWLAATLSIERAVIGLRLEGHRWRIGRTWLAISGLADEILKVGDGDPSMSNAEDGLASTADPRPQRAPREELLWQLRTLIDSLDDCRDATTEDLVDIIQEANRHQVDGTTPTPQRADEIARLSADLAKQIPSGVRYK
jgi:hypothetical protein